MKKPQAKAALDENKVRKLVTDGIEAAGWKALKRKPVPPALVQSHLVAREVSMRFGEELIKIALREAQIPKEKHPAAVREMKTMVRTLAKVNESLISKNPTSVKELQTAIKKDLIANLTKAIGEEGAKRLLSEYTKAENKNAILLSTAIGQRDWMMKVQGVPKRKRK